MPRGDEREAMNFAGTVSHWVLLVVSQMAQAVFDAVAFEVTRDAPDAGITLH